MIREMHLLRDVLEKDVVGSAANELQTIFGTAEVELAKQEKLFQALLTDKNGLIENIPANLEAAGAHYRNVVKPQIDDWITGPGKAWVEKTVPAMHTAGRRLASVNLDVQDLSPELVKAAFDNVLVGEKAVLRVGFTDGYRIMNVVGDDVGEWFRQTTNDAVIEGIPVTHYDPNVDSLQSRLMHSGRIKPITIKSKTGKTIHRSIKQRAQAIARIESTRIMNRTHEVLADEVLGDEAVFRNSNPQDSRSTFICTHASSQKAMTLLEWDNTPYGRPPRLSPFHLCRSVLIGGRPEWFDDVPEAQLQGAGLAKTTTKAVKTLTSIQKAAQTTAQLAQVALSEAAAAAAKKIATTSQATKAVAIGKQIDDILVGPSPQIHQKKLNSLLTEYQAVAPAAEWASKKKLQVGVFKASKIVETESKIAGKLAQAADLDLSDALKNETFSFEAPPWSAGNMKPLMKEWHDLTGDILVDDLTPKIVAWKKQYQDAWETAIIARQKPLKNKWTTAESLDLEPQLAAKKKILKDMEGSSLFAGGQMSSFQDNIGYLIDGIKHSQMVEMQNEFLTLHGVKNFDGAKAHLAKMKTADVFEDFQILKAQEMLEELGIEPKIVDYDDLLAQVASGTLGPKKTITVKKKIKKLGDEIHLMKAPGTVGHFPSDIAKAIQAAEAELAAKFSPEVVAFHNEYAKLITTKKVPIADAADILTKHKAGTLHGKASAKAKQAVEAVKDSLDPPAPIIPDAPEPPPPVGQIHADFADVDKAWDEIDANEHFTFQGEANVGGMHSKEFFVDPSGERWLFKPFPNISAKEATFRGMSDEFAYKLQRVIDVDAPEARFVQMGNRRGSIQRWREGGTGTLEDVKTAAAVADLTPAQLAHIQREHVLDWLLSNHDGHGGQFVTFSDGKLLGVDKGQAYRWFGEDKLDFDYHPNSRYGEREPLFNTMMKGLRDGKVDLDPKVTLEAIELFEGISDDVLESFAHDYATARFGTGAARKTFIDGVVGRKNALRADFEDYYRRALKDPTFSFGAVPGPTPTSVIPAGTLAPKNPITQTLLDIADESESHGWQGKVLDLNGEDIEDLRGLMFADELGGTTRTNIELKLRPGGDKKVMEWINKQDIDDALPTVAPVAVPSPQTIGATLAEDTLGSFGLQIEKSVITLNSHMKAGGNKVPNPTTITKMLADKPKLQPLLVHPDPDVAKMAEIYLDTIEDIEDAIKAEQQLTSFSAFVTKDLPGGKKGFTPYKRQNLFTTPDVPSPVVVPPPVSTKGYRVVKQEAHFTKRTPLKGKLGVDVDRHPGKDFHHQFDGNTGVQYEITWDDGTRARYLPHDDLNNAWESKKGALEFMLPERPSAASLTRALHRFEELGLDATMSSPLDLELMYLTKQAYSSKEHVKAAYVTLVGSLSGKSQIERIAALRKYWARKKPIKDRMKAQGVTELQDLKEYDPAGVWQTSHHGTGEAGYRSWSRFDIFPEDVDKFALQHNLTAAPGGMGQFVEECLTNNGVMASTVEKMRIGVPVGGLSPGADMRRGGGSYFYTRLRTKSQMRGGGIYFKGDRVRRMDAISYHEDSYGETRADFVTTNRHETVKKWEKIADAVDTDETIFKKSLSIVDDVDIIKATTATEKNRIIKAYKDAGHAVLPDGRAIEEVVKI